MAEIGHDDIVRSNVDDELLRHLIDALCVSPSSLFVAMAMSMVLTITVWLLTWDPLCGIFVALNVLVGVKRLRLDNQYRRLKGVTLDRARMLAFDRQFLYWWTMFSAGIGFQNFVLAATTEEPADWTLASSIAVGFTVAFALRSAGRMKLFIAQVMRCVRR